MVNLRGSQINKKCPCCEQPMPITDFALYPKSTAIIRNGYVQQLGIVQFAIVERLYRVMPEPVSIEVLHAYAYGSSKEFGIHLKNLSANIWHLRKKLRRFRISIVTVHQNGYKLMLDPWKETK